MAKKRNFSGQAFHKHMSSVSAHNAFFSGKDIVLINPFVDQIDLSEDSKNYIVRLEIDADLKVDTVINLSNLEPNHFREHLREVVDYVFQWLAEFHPKKIKSHYLKKQDLLKTINSLNDLGLEIFITLIKDKSLFEDALINSSHLQ